MPYDGQPSHSSAGLPLYEARIAPFELDPNSFIPSTAAVSHATRPNSVQPASKRKEENESGNEVESYIFLGYARSMSRTTERSIMFRAGLQLFFTVLRLAIGLYGVYFFVGKILASSNGSNR